MLFQIRFQRFGRRKSPFYRIVAIDSKSRRQGVPIEVIIILILLIFNMEDGLRLDHQTGPRTESDY